MNSNVNNMIFISYRRDDSAGTTGRMVESLKKSFSKKHFFRDIDNITGGEKYAATIKRSIEDCEIFIVVIGPRWLPRFNTALPKDPTDWVRYEIGLALKKKKQIIPILVDGARFPAAADLPTDIQALAEYNAEELTDRRWDYDIGQLVTNLKSKGMVLAKEEKSSKTLVWTLNIFITLAVVVSGYFVYQYFNDKASEKNIKTSPEYTKPAPARIEGRWYTIVPQSSNVYYSIIQDKDLLEVKRITNDVRETTGKGYIDSNQVFITLFDKVSGADTLRGIVSNDGKIITGTTTRHIGTARLQVLITITLEKR